MGLGHLCFVIGAQSLVARQSAPAEQDRNFGHFTIGASLGQLIGPIAAGYLISERDGAMARTSALALLVSAAVAAVSLTSLWRIEHAQARRSEPRGPARKVPVGGILRTRGVPAGIFISLAVLCATDILTAYLPVVGEHRGIAPATVGLLLSLRAAATIACRLVMTPMLRLVGRAALLSVTCLLGGLLCAAVALPVPVWALAVMLAVLGFCLGVGQPLSMTTVVQAAPADARSTALALRLTGNRLGQVAAPAVGRADRRSRGHGGAVRDARRPAGRRGGTRAPARRDAGRDATGGGTVDKVPAPGAAPAPGAPAVPGARRRTPVRRAGPGRDGIRAGLSRHRRPDARRAPCAVPPRASRPAPGHPRPAVRGWPAAVRDLCLRPFPGAEKLTALVWAWTASVRTTHGFGGRHSEPGRDSHEGA